MGFIGVVAFHTVSMLALLVGTVYLFRNKKI